MRDENRYHGYPTLGEIVKVLAVAIVTAPYTIPAHYIKKGLKKLKGKNAKSS